MSRLRLALVIVLTFAVLAVAFLSFSRELTGEDYLEDFVLEQLEENLGRKIDVHRVKFVLFPRIRVELADVRIHDPESEQIVLTAKRVDLVLRLLPLLKKQVVGKRLLIEEPTLTLRRNERGLGMSWTVCTARRIRSANDRYDGADTHDQRGDVGQRNDHGHRCRQTGRHSVPRVRARRV